MTKRRRPPKDSVPPHPPSARDDMMRDITRLLGRKQFDSIDDVKSFMERELMGKTLPHVQPITDRERAEDLVSAARDEMSPAKARALATQALALDAYCVDAHLLLAEMSVTPPEALAHAKAGVDAGGHVLNDRHAEEDLPFWFVDFGRRYLTAKLFLAELLWEMGDRPAAIEEARTILRLNKDDNQGVRYILLGWLMRAGSIADIDALLAEYDERVIATWAFSKALHAYRTRGVVNASDDALRVALRANAHVAPMLLGKSELPDELPGSFTVGGRDEAATYVSSALSMWFETPGAIDWLARVARATPLGGGGRAPRKR